MGDVVISCRLGGSYGGLQHTCSPPGELQSLSELAICYLMVCNTLSVNNKQII